MVRNPPLPPPWLILPFSAAQTEINRPLQLLSVLWWCIKDSRRCVFPLIYLWLRSLQHEGGDAARAPEIRSNTPAPCDDPPPPLRCPTAAWLEVEMPLCCSSSEGRRLFPCVSERTERCVARWAAGGDWWWLRAREEVGEKRRGGVRGRGGLILHIFTTDDRWSFMIYLRSHLSWLDVIFLIIIIFFFYQSVHLNKYIVF